MWRVLTSFLGLVAALPLVAIGATGPGSSATSPVEGESASPVVIEVDTSQAPELKTYGEKVQRLAEKWYPIIAADLPDEGFKPPTHVTITFKNMDGVAYTTGSRIFCSAKWFTDRPGDMGAIVHELVHVVQHYTIGQRPGWLVEGIADYIRWFQYESETSRPRPNPKRAKYDDSYRTTAAFLDWAQSTYDKDLVVKLNSACRRGVYRAELWKKYTGKTADELGQEWLAHLQSAPVKSTSSTRASIETDQPTNESLRFSSPSLDVTLDAQRPAIALLAVDGLGAGKLGLDVLHATTRPAMQPNADAVYSLARVGGETPGVQYRRVGSAAEVEPGWTINVGEREIQMHSRWSPGERPEPLVIRIEHSQCYATLLGRLDPDGHLLLPAILHLPSHGTFRITRTDGGASDPASAWLGYTTIGKTTVQITVPAATAASPHVDYRWEVVAIHPPLGGFEGVRAFDAVRRDWLNIFQLNPSRRLLSNHTTSDTCAFCYYEYADLAKHAPPLADGLTVLDIVRQTLDTILAGGKAYGMPGFGKGTYTEPSADTNPSLLIAARDCFDDETGKAWAAKNYPGIKHWADDMLAADRDGDGLIEYAVSGNSGSWNDGQPTTRPSNWWDTIGFGNKDAYSNALAYRALRGMVGLATATGHSEDAERCRAAADKLARVYFNTFYNPATGVLAGWRSADGELHDYCFLWVNGIAIHYGLVPTDKANAIMDRLLSKMASVGYTRFDLGLPGNPVPVPLKDYTHRILKYGGGQLADNSDAFQIYENGGATSCFAYFVIAALYDLGRTTEGDQMLLPLLQSIEQGDFERSIGRKSNDWRKWDGEPTGYEGYLTDNYYVLLAALDRAHDAPGAAVVEPPPPTTRPAFGIANRATYLSDVCQLLKTEWPKNRAVNIVCHGHSVPASDAKAPAVPTCDAYPQLLHRALCDQYPAAVVNIIITAVGDEDSESGAKRFDSDVLAMHPDVVTIDYGLNDRRIGLVRAKKAWGSMIERALAAHVKVVLLTPTPDERSPLTDPNDMLNQQAEQIAQLASHYHVGLVDSLDLFKRYVEGGGQLNGLMAQVNYPNRKGHQLVAEELSSWFPK